MSTLTLSLLLAGALTGGFVSGLTGFGTGLIALGFWLYVFPPAVAVPLVLICSMVSQASTLRSFWRLVDVRLALPLVIGGLAGVAPGALLVPHADPHGFKLFVGILLLVFPTALYVSRPMVLSFGGRAADVAIGFVGGVMGGLAGLSGPIPILWASVRGWDKNQRRGIFLAFNSSILIAALLLQIGTGPRHPRSRHGCAVRLARHADRRLAGCADVSRAQRPFVPRRGAGAAGPVRRQPGVEQPRRGVSDRTRARPVCPAPAFPIK